MSKTMKLLLLCLVLISTNQGFFIPPKSSCIFANNCQEQSLEETVQEHPIIRIKGHQPKVKALSYYDYPLPRKFVLKQIIDKLLKLRNAIVAKPFRATISRMIWEKICTSMWFLKYTKVSVAWLDFLLCLDTTALSSFKYVTICTWIHLIETWLPVPKLF